MGDLWLQIYQILRDHKQTQVRTSEALVSRFEQSSSFARAKDNMALLEEVKYWDTQLLDRIAAAADDNGQIRNSFGVPARVAKLIQKNKTHG